MKQKYTYAKLSAPEMASVLVFNKVVVLLPKEDTRKGWMVVQLVDEHKEPYGFPFPVKVKYLIEHKFEKYGTEEELLGSESDSERYENW